MTGPDLPEAKGTYVLIVRVNRLQPLEIGRLGAYELRAGFYSYVGSAFGAGGLRARVGHHLESAAQPHWHIDYLLQQAETVEVWYALSDRKLEHDLAELLERSPGFQMPIPRFGSSDYRRSRTSHLLLLQAPALIPTVPTGGQPRHRRTRSPAWEGDPAKRDREP